MVKITGKLLTVDQIVFTDNTAIYNRDLYVTDNFLLLPAQDTTEDEEAETMDIIPIANVKEIKTAQIKKSTQKQPPIYRYRDIPTW